jgi:anti-sigma regulatory factor (Ser/Thr protein kinase)
MLAHARALCGEIGLTPALTLKIELVIEELFSNTITHGYGGECDTPVWLQLLVQPGALCMIYQDAATAFDPLQHDIRIADTLEARPRGGLGIRLVRSLATDFAYRRVGGRNVLTLTFRA